jgi:hypothetical protein
MSPAARPIEQRGVRVDAPAGCEARLRTRVPDADEVQGAAVAAAAAGEERLVLHVATVALPAHRGDFGGGVVEQLGRDDVFVAVLELEPDQAGSAFVRREGIPRSLAPGRYATDTMQRTIHGQAGTQVFFSQGGRAFCLYVVLGSHARRNELARTVNRILEGITIR